MYLYIFVVIMIVLQLFRSYSACESLVFLATMYDK